MAAWEPQKLDLTQINNGQEYNDGDGVGASSVNAAVESAAWAQNYAESLTATPDLTEAGNVGSPTVSFVDNGNYKKFKFSNLKGETGNTGISVKDVNFIYNSESSTEVVYDVKTTLDDNTIVDSGQVKIPKSAYALDPDAVHYTAQTLTAEQQEQARANIGAASKGNYALQDGTYSEMTVGNATNATNAETAETADKVANALTIRNQTGTGNILYNGSSALTIDLAPQTTNVYAEIAAAYSFAFVYAHIVMQRRGNKADIHMDFRIDLRGGNPTSDWTLFTAARLAYVLGLSSLSFESNNTRVMIENCPSSTFGTVGGVYAGYTGFMLAFDSTSTSGIGIGRFFNQPSNDGVGGWEVTTEEVYSEDYIYHADIWGADVS